MRKGCPGVMAGGGHWKCRRGEDSGVLFPINQQLPMLRDVCRKRLLFIDDNVLSTKKCVLRFGSGRSSEPEGCAHRITLAQVVESFWNPAVIVADRTCRPSSLMLGSPAFCRCCLPTISNCHLEQIPYGTNFSTARQKRLPLFDIKLAVCDKHDPVLASRSHHAGRCPICLRLSPIRFV